MRITRYFRIYFINFSFNCYMSFVLLIFPYSAQILLENVVFCRHNAHCHKYELCSKFFQQNLSKPTCYIVIVSSQLFYSLIKVHFSANQSARCMSVISFRKEGGRGVRESINFNLITRWQENSTVARLVIESSQTVVGD